MRKSPSSSLKKKKRSKISSQVRIKKRSKSRTRRSNKLKKVRRREDSVSYSSDSDDSRSSVSIPSSSSEDDYRSKRSRSRMRKYVNGSKKRRRRSSSCERIEDSPRVKKRKGSKKNDDFQVKKKRLEKKKKKSRRDVSVSSSSSGSWSCSTCNSSSDESEIEKNRGRSERKYKDRRRLGKVKNESKSRRSRSRSYSFCNQFSEYTDHNIEDKLAGEANSRRLRSVITVVREGEDVTGLFNDEHKEEMVYDRDDYPSSRSNDSIDGGSKRELVHNSHVASEENRHEEVEEGEAVVSNIGTCKVMESHRNGEGQDGSNPSCDGVEMNDDVKGKKNQDSGGVDSMSGYDLELILRQKALENLRIRRGYQADAKVPITPKDVISCEVNTPSTTNSRSSQKRFSNGGGDGLMGASHVAEQSSAPGDLSMNNDKISDRNDNGKGSAKHDVQYPPDLLALAGNPKGPVSSETSNSTSVELVSKPELSSTCTTKKQLFTLQEPPQAKSIARNNVDKSMVEATPTVNPLGGNNNDKETNNGSASDDPSSCTKSPCGGTSSNKPEDETNEGSGYRQKTMTVMRGGEMVEVSYKVYIPKKAPALARRQLRR